MLKREFLPTRLSFARCFLLMGVMLCIFLMDNPSLVSLLGGVHFYAIIKSALWVGLAFIVWSSPDMGYKVKTRQLNLVNIWAFLFAALFVIASILAGVVDGFGKNPFDRSLSGIVGNIMLFGPMLVAKELIRSHLVNSFTDKENYLVFILLALFMAVINIPVNTFAKLTEYKDYMGVVQFVAQTFAPEVTKNLLAVYFAYLGGPLPSLIYMGVLQAFQLTSPLLPNLKWLTATLVGVLIPVFSLSFMEQIYLTDILRVKVKVNNAESPLSWMITSVLSIAIIWFSVGLFSIYPSVVVTGSMEPMIKPGDVILVNKNVDKYKLNVGDVIQFKSDKIWISHRIIKVLKSEDGDIKYRTRGDNNSAMDYDPVEPQQVKGRIIKVVPKVGWPTLLLKNRRTIPMEQVQF